MIAVVEPVLLPALAGLPGPVYRVDIRFQVGEDGKVSQVIVQGLYGADRDGVQLATEAMTVPAGELRGKRYFVVYTDGRLVLDEDLDPVPMHTEMAPEPFLPPEPPPEPPPKKP